MDFNYSAEDEAFRAEFREWLEPHRHFAVLFIYHKVFLERSSDALLVRGRSKPLK